ncbi:MAG: type II toxin-antitoxin system VapB family antitoxin [Burkholderiaceae bacterium]|nr:type II toxin-antitoxin system VapB family antitoxin [Burkholderiaceae bacterium]
MKTHVEVDDDLLQEVLRLGAFETKKAAINAALVELSKSLKRRELLALRGKVRWHGDLDLLRAVRNRGAGGAG